MLTQLARWWLSGDLLEEYIRGWTHGVQQHMHDPDSCIAPRRYGGEWPTYEQYWGLD